MSAVKKELLDFHEKAEQHLPAGIQPYQGLR
jgi:hypothetical protein